MKSISRPIFLRGIRGWINHKGLHWADVMWAVVCIVAFTLSLAWPRNERPITTGPCRVVIHSNVQSSTAYYGRFNEAGECVVIRKVAK